MKENSFEYCDVFFDLHGVLANTNLIMENYLEYLAKILLDLTQLNYDEVKKIHEKSFREWQYEIRKITEYSEASRMPFDPEVFMKQYKDIDRRWETSILNYIPINRRSVIKPLLKTSTVEYEALAKGSHSSIYPEVHFVLSKLVKISNIRLNIASSASSFHVKGFLEKENLNCFNAIIGYDTVRAPKKMLGGIYFKKMIEQTKCNPLNSYFVGDSMEEAVLSKQFGLKFILVDRGNHLTGNSTYPNNLTVINTLIDLLPLIKC